MKLYYSTYYVRDTPAQHGGEDLGNKGADGDASAVVVFGGVWRVLGNVRPGMMGPVVLVMPVETVALAVLVGVVVLAAMVEQAVRAVQAVVQVLVLVVLVEAVVEAVVQVVLAALAVRDALVRVAVMLMVLALVAVLVSPGSQVSPGSLHCVMRCRVGLSGI